MASLNTILQWFKTGLIPTEAQFSAAWSSFRHKDNPIPFSEVEGLTQAFENTVGLEIIGNVTADLNTRAKADASNINVIAWKEALDITNIATVDGDNPDGNVYDKTQIDEIVTILHERDDTNAQLIDDIKNTLLSNDINLDELQEVINFIKQNREDIEQLQQISVGNTNDDKISLIGDYSLWGAITLQNQLNDILFDKVQQLIEDVQSIGTGRYQTEIRVNSTLNHGLNSYDLIVEAYDTITLFTTPVKVRRVDFNNVEIEFDSVPDNFIKIIIRKI